MKKTLIALTALVAATVGLQTQAQAGHRYTDGPGFQFDVQLGNGAGFTAGEGYRRVHQSYRYSDRRNRRGKHYGYKRRYRCYVAGKRQVRRSLRSRGFYDIRRLRRYGKIYSAKAVSPRGYLVKLRINGCNYRIVNRRIIRDYRATWSGGYAWGRYW